MTREQDLENLLAELVEHLKALYATLSSVMIQTAALQQAISSRPKSRRLYAKKMEAAVELARPLVQTAMRSYDDMIQRIRESDAPKKESPESDSAKITRLN